MQRRLDQLKCDLERCSVWCRENAVFELKRSAGWWRSY